MEKITIEIIRNTQSNQWFCSIWSSKKILDKFVYGEQICFMEIKELEAKKLIQQSDLKLQPEYYCRAEPQGKYERYQEEKYLSTITNINPEVNNAAIMCARMTFKNSDLTACVIGRAKRSLLETIIMFTDYFTKTFPSKHPKKMELFLAELDMYTGCKPFQTTTFDSPY